MQIFYASVVRDSLIFLDEMEARHCLKVLRKKPGDQLEVVDGRGNYYLGEIIALDKKNCQVSIKRHIPAFKQRKFHLQIAIAPTKNINRFEWFLEKATEIGIDEVTPILCARSERRTIRPDRLNKVLIAAMKQSLQAYLPRLNPLVSLPRWLDDSTEGGYIAYCEENEKVSLYKNYHKEKYVKIMIGPEGDFTKEEVQMAIDKGFQPVSLGPNRLRTETAGIVACSIINMLNEAAS